MSFIVIPLNELGCQERSPELPRGGELDGLHWNMSNTHLGELKPQS